MKRYAFIFALVLAMAIASPYAFAQGTPGAHGLSGAEFGDAVSGKAQTDPGGLAGHVSGERGGNKGAPGAHGLSGAEFGGAASEAATSSPGAVGGHASGVHGNR